MTPAASTGTAPSPTAALSAQGVSIWLDDLSRGRILSGGLETLLAGRNVVGITTNPTIFASAVSTGHAYDAQLASLAASGTSSSDAVFAITTADVAHAADLLRPIHDATTGLDGWVSIEVSAASAHDSHATIEEAERLTAAIARPNVFVKIPATRAGLDAISTAIARGISINVTLIFSLERYRAVIDAYLSGLEQAHAAGVDLRGIRSVASFFVSRVDTEVDKRLDAIGSDAARSLRGKAGVANARLAYEIYEQAFSTERAQRLAALGAHPQRPLWASTGVKDPALRDTYYVEELVAPGVVNTMPERTLQATFDHGEIRGNTVAGTYEQSRRILAAVADLGISFDEVTLGLENAGVAAFAASGEQLTDTVAKALAASSKTGA
ncbi:transaldolase [Mycetocola sp. 2940]|uniref:transaldolase n=1 Tax=Mycetocola sp. 2940 TaxID=3156452 RepID=UPI003395325E